MRLFVPYPLTRTIAFRALSKSVLASFFKEAKSCQTASASDDIQRTSANANGMRSIVRADFGSDSDLVPVAKQALVELRAAVPASSLTKSAFKRFATAGLVPWITEKRNPQRGSFQISR